MDPFFFPSDLSSPLTFSVFLCCTKKMITCLGAVTKIYFHGILYRTVFPHVNFLSNSSLTWLQTVYDHDTFSKDDKMGYAEFDIKAFMEALKMNLKNLPSGTTITRMLPARQNCLAEESCVVWKDGKVVQDIYLRLRNVECGEVEVQLQWINLPSSKG